MTMERDLTRRHLLAGGAAAAALSGCARPPAIAPSTVSIVRAPRYGQELYAKVREILEAHRLDDPAPDEG